MISHTVTSSHSRGEDELTIADYLLHQHGNSPESTALIFHDERLSYRQLLERGLSIAEQLKAVGVNNNDKVGLLYPNHCDYVAAFFAILLCGAIVVPINPMLKSEEIAHILADSEARAIIVHELVSSEVAASLTRGLITATVICFRYGGATELPTAFITLETAKLARATMSVGKPARSEDLAVLVYTSGTTGKPKGAMLSHANLRSAVSMSETFLEFSAQDRFLAVLPLCHIYGLTVVMLALISKGGTLVIADRFEPAVALNLIEEHKITFLPAVPAMYQFMLFELQKAKYDLSSLRACLSGAAPMPLKLFSAVESAFHVPIVEGYGLTESSSIASVNPLHGTQKLGSVGVPMPGLQIKIVTGDGSFAERGAANIGEVAIKGPNVMQGYYKSPEATALAFSGDWLLTGDLGYIDSESYLFLVGRTKELIIRGGQNIYPREVEEVISRLAAVAEVAVIGVPDQFMGERVKAVIAVKPAHNLTEDDVKRFCADNLADFKVPRLVEFVQSLPRNSTGKVLKRILQDH